MFEFLRFELIVHDSAGGVVFRVVTWIITVMIGAVPALCARCRKRPQKMGRREWGTKRGSSNWVVGVWEYASERGTDRRSVCAADRCSVEGGP